MMKHVSLWSWHPESDSDKLPRHRSWGSLRLALVLTALLFALAACTDDAAQDQEVAPKTGPQSDGVPQELIVGTASDPWVDMEMALKWRPNMPLNTNVCDTLLRVGYDYQLETGLASDWELVGDNTFRFTMDENAHFADGTPIDAEAVKYSMNYIGSDPDTSTWAGLEISSAEVTVVDDRTVDITPQDLTPRFAEDTVQPVMSILQPGSDPLAGISPFECSGPFKVVDYEPEEFIVVARNENYWGEPALLDRIEFRFIDDNTTRALALENGEVDLITDVPRPIARQFEHNPDVQVKIPPSMGESMHLYLARRDEAGSEKLLADPLLRRAVAAAIDPVAYIAVALDGYGEVTGSITPPALFGEHAELLEGVPFDPEEAAGLLEEAGWMLAGGDEFRTRDGETLKVTMIYGGQFELRGAELIQAQLEAVGFDVDIEQLEPGAYTEAREQGRFDIDLATFNQSTGNHVYVPAMAVHSSSRAAQAPFVAPGPDTEYERLLNEALETYDVEEVKRLAAEAMAELVNEEVAVVPLAGVYPIFAMRPEVQGFEAHPSRITHRWWNVFIAE